MAEPALPRPPGRDPNREERLEVLRLLEGGEITADEAGTLLDALDRADRLASPKSPGDVSYQLPGRARLVRIRITDSDTGRATVNLAVPLGLVDAGLTIARRYAPDRLLDAKTIKESLDTGFRGPLLDVDDGGERVEIIVE